MPKRQFNVAADPITRSAPMRALDDVIRAVAPKEVGVTIIGER